MDYFSSAGTETLVRIDGIMDSSKWQIWHKTCRALLDSWRGGEISWHDPKAHIRVNIGMAEEEKEAAAEEDHFGIVNSTYNDSKMTWGLHTGDPLIVW